MLNRNSEIEVWSWFVCNLWYEHNSWVRCAFGNVCINQLAIHLFQVYSFKVTAVNKIGASSQSQPSYHMMTLRYCCWWGGGLGWGGQGWYWWWTWWLLGIFDDDDADSGDDEEEDFLRWQMFNWWQWQFLWQFELFNCHHPHHAPPHTHHDHQGASEWKTNNHISAQLELKQHQDLLEAS